MTLMEAHLPFLNPLPITMQLIYGLDHHSNAGCFHVLLRRYSNTAQTSTGKILIVILR